MAVSAAVWREAFGTFERLLGLGDGAREIELAALAQARPDLYPHVLTLIKAEGQARSGDFLAGDPMESAGRRLAPEDTPGHRPGDRIGPYELQRALGSGGMGEVWLARRADGVYDTPVALKLLHAHIALVARNRFVREGRILGQLNHPHIAHLLDAGVADNGQMYLAIEQVEGEPLDRWCDGRRLSVESRLRLMLQVCEAVAHAHARLVVHRDLKPSNILVTNDGDVKLLDFGIAKLVAADEALVAQTELTRLGGRMLTPEFAAPEQLSDQPVTVATDVYALGVLLYLLLSGRHPYGRPGMSQSQLERAVLETEPVPLSRTRAAIGTEASTPELAALRASTPPTLRAALAGDLDTIVLKALKKNPAERYASVPALAEDLRRYLEHLPVLARPDSFRYRTQKYLRRHRVGVATTAAIIVAVIAGVASTLWQTQVAREHERSARQQAQRADRVKDFVVSLFREQNPFRRSASAARTPQQMLADAAARLDEELGAEPEVHAELLDDLGGIQTDLGDLQSSETLLERAIQERTKHQGADSLAVAQSLAKLSRVRLSQSRYDDAGRLARRALAIQQAHADAEPLEIARTQVYLAHAISIGKGAPPEAEALYGSALPTLERVLGPDDPETIAALNFVAEMHVQARQQDKAEAEVRELVARCQRRYGEQSAPFATALLTLGDVLASAKKPQEAVEAFARGTTVLREQVGERSADLANGLSHMAIQLRELRRFDEAKAAYDRAERALPEGEVSNRSDILRGKGRVALLLHRPDEAERDLRMAYELRRQAAGENNGFTWYYASEWGRGLAAQGRLAEAESIQRKALKRLGEIMGPTAYQNALLMTALADTLERLKDRRADAIAMRRQALEVIESKYPKSHPQWAGYAVALAHSLADVTTAAAQAEGLALSEQALAVYRANPGDSQALDEAQLEHAGFLARAGQRDEASE